MRLGDEPLIAEPDQASDRLVEHRDSSSAVAATDAAARGRNGLNAEAGNRMGDVRGRPQEA
jgi:hypothetical protein